jgi:hypothetical protein
LRATQLDNARLARFHAHMLIDHLGAAVLAAGALGTAAFGIVEGMKRWRFVGEAGFTTLLKLLAPLLDALTKAYGKDTERLLRAQYRGDSRELARIIRQGARLGLTPQNAAALATALGVVDPAKLVQVAQAIEAGKDLTAEERNILGRFELAVDARIESAMTLALDMYRRTVIIVAAFIAVAIALVVGWQLGVPLLQAVLVGVAAVPLAPVAKDVAAALKAAADALRART